jgi:hypothetical protein
MSRNQGTFNFAANFEPLVKAPLDARMRVENYSDLIDASIWKDADENIWLYKGAIVSVANDPSAGIYFLADDTTFTNYSSWIPAGSGTSLDSSLGVINIGSGDVSIYAGLVRSNIALRELKAGSGITLSYPDSSTIQIATTGGGGTGVNGGVFVTDINPTSSGNVGDKVFSSDGVVLDSCLTDTNFVTVSVLAITGNTNYKPVVTIGASPVTLSADSDKPLFNGSLAINLNDASTITVLHEDGAEHTVSIEYDNIPVILGATFVNGYPGSQTELKAGDTFDVSIVTDSPVDSITLVGGSGDAFSTQTFSVTSGTSHVITGAIRNAGTSTQNLPFTVYANKPTGSQSVNFTSDSQGTTDGQYRVALNNTYPSINITGVTYPASQQAIKSGEFATIANTVTNFDTIQYDNILSQLTISSPTSYDTSKIATYLSGSYNISSPNFSISATRTANDATSTASTTVYIANVAPTLTVVNPAARLRSGGNDGTSIQNHTITIQSNQNLISGPTLATDGGSTASWQSSSTFTGGPTTWTNTLQVHDDDTKGTYNWGAISGTGLSGINTISNSGASTYTLGGFVSRNVSIEAFGTQGTINVEVVDYSKLNNTLNWSVKSLTSKQPVGTTTTPIANGWSIDALNSNPTTINILDTAAAASSSQASTIIGVQESV